MTKQEYETSQKALAEEFKDRERRLALNYLVANNPYSIGDIITDHYHTIRITGWRLYAINPPCLMYQGTELKKDLTAAKLQRDTTMFAANVKHYTPII